MTSENRRNGFNGPVRGCIFHYEDSVCCLTSIEGYES
jgi:hypothetical protein